MAQHLIDILVLVSSILFLLPVALAHEESLYRPLHSDQKFLLVHGEAEWGVGHLIANLMHPIRDLRQ